MVTIVATVAKLVIAGVNIRILLTLIADKMSLTLGGVHQNRVSGSCALYHIYLRLANTVEPDRTEIVSICTTFILEQKGSSPEAGWPKVVLHQVTQVT